MSANDSLASVFWSRGPSRTDPPSNSALFTGKTVNEDPVTDRADETVGYIVIETGAGTLAGRDYEALLGADSVRGVDNSPPYAYPLASLSSADVAVASLAGMDGGNGGCAMLYGSLPADGSEVGLAIDEDVLNDGERRHTTEQVSTIVFSME